MLSRKKKNNYQKQLHLFYSFHNRFLIGYYQSYLQNKREEHLAKEHNLEFDEKVLSQKLNYNQKKIIIQN